MRKIKIMAAGPYELFRYGNGTAYELLNHGNEDGPPWSVFVQDDAAAQFRAEIDAIEAANPTKPTRDVLGDMWVAYWQGE